MKLHRFFSKHIGDKEKINLFSNSSIVHQLSRVFRLHVGDNCIFFDGSGNDYVSEIVSMRGEELGFCIIETKVVEPKSLVKLALAVSLIKKDNFEWVIQKGTELGVTEFIPIISERSEKKGLNMERAEKIMIEALEQSGRSDMVKIIEPISIEEFVKNEKREVIVFHTEGENFSEEIISNKDVVACVGPEGGWSEKEIENFKKAGAKIVKLNTPVLRAETAAVAVSTLILAK